MNKSYKFTSDKKYLLISSFLGNKERHGGVKRSDQVNELFEDFDCKSCNPYLSFRLSIKKAFKYPFIFLDSLIFSLFYISKGLSLKGVILFSFKSVEIIKFINSNKDREIVLDGGGNVPIILMNYLNFKKIEFCSFCHNIEYLVPERTIFNYFRSNKDKYDLEIKGYNKSNSIFTISELDSAILGCHGIPSELINYYPCKKDFKSLNKIRKFRIENSLYKDNGHALLLGTVLNPPTKAGMLNAIKSFKEQKCIYPLKVAGYGTDVFKEFNSKYIKVFGSVSDEELNSLIKNAKFLIINQVQTSGFLTKIVDFNIAGVPIFVTSNYYQATYLQKYGVFKVHYSDIPKLFNSKILDENFRIFKRPTFNYSLN